MVESELTVNVAEIPLNRTPIASVKPLPLIVTFVPTGPEAGLNPLIVGEGMTVKLDGLVALPPAVVTVIEPEVAPAGTGT